MGLTKDSSVRDVPIVIATKTAKCLPVLLASIDQYVPQDVAVFVSGSDLRLPRHKTINVQNIGDNFGDSYNHIVSLAYSMFDEVIVANDDIVLTPSSYELLMADVELLPEDTAWVSAKSDYVRGYQNIRAFKEREGIRYVEERKIIPTEIISPLFGYIHKDKWVDYKPINWYSDDIQCLEIKANGYKNYVSRSYVHHVGSQTIGMDHGKNQQEAETWIKANMPELHQRWFTSQK
jgi:hypothetical protein